MKNSLALKPMAIQLLKNVIARMTRDNLFPANVPKTIEESFYVVDGHGAEVQFKGVVEFKHKRSEER